MGLVAVYRPHNPDPSLTYIGFSPTQPPADSLAFRKALALAIDKSAVAHAVAVHFAVPRTPAAGIQHPGLPGYSRDTSPQAFDPARARALYRQSGWRGPVTILVSSAATRYARAYRDAVAQSIHRSLGAQVILKPAQDVGGLTRAAESGAAAVYMLRWQADPKDLGYPSFALGLAHDFFLSNDDVRRPVENNDALRLERLLLERALIVPLSFDW